MSTVGQNRAPDGPARVAINLIDLDRCSDAELRSMIVGNVDATAAVRTNPGRADEAAVAFSCSDLVAACVCDTLRAADRGAGLAPSRVYLRRRGGWEKLPAAACLTVVVNGRPVLNPEYFNAAGLPERGGPAARPIF